MIARSLVNANALAALMKGSTSRTSPRVSSFWRSRVTLTARVIGQWISPAKSSSNVRLQGNCLYMRVAQASSVSTKMVDYQVTWYWAMSQFIGKAMNTCSSFPGIAIKFGKDSKCAVALRVSGSSPQPAVTKAWLVIRNWAKLIYLLPETFFITFHAPILSRPAVAGRKEVS